MVEMPQPPATVRWQKSRLSGGNACVEVAGAHEHFWIRDSKNPLGPAVGFPREGWAVFLVGVQRDELRPDHPGMPT